MRELIEQYKEKGYTPIQNSPSGLGSELMRNHVGDRVVKFAQDPAYDVFVEYAIASSRPQYPTFYAHTKPAGEFEDRSNAAYTVTEMEHLSPLTAQEAIDVERWVSALFAALKNRADPMQVPDPFGLSATLLDLVDVATQCKVNLDVQKPDNYMARVTKQGRQIVFVDPFN